MSGANDSRERIISCIRQEQESGPDSIGALLDARLLRMEGESYVFQCRTFPWMRNGFGTLHGGLSSTIQELLMSAEYIMSEGNDQVILCERGIRTFETATRNTLDLSAVSVIHNLSHLPVVVDPSHATGKANLVAPMAYAAAACGADAIMIEVHNNPSCALCDGAQSLTPSQFEDLSRQVTRIREAIV